GRYQRPALSTTDLGPRYRQPARSPGSLQRGDFNDTFSIVNRNPAAARGDFRRRSFARRLAQAVQPLAAAPALAGCRRVRGGLLLVERARPRPGNNRTGLL